MTEDNRVSLKKTLSRTEIWAFAFGSVVGWGWIMLAGGWVKSAGTLGAIVAFVISAVMVGLVGLLYAELTPMLPLSGGEMVWAYRCSGYNFAWICGWAICFAYVAVAAWEGPAFATAVSYLIPDLPQGMVFYNIAGFDVNSTFVLLSVAGSVFIMFCHYRGMKLTAIFNTIAAVVLVLGGLIFCFGSVAKGSAGNALPLFSNGFSGMAAVMMAAPAMFIGFDVIPQASEEMKIPKKQLGYLVLFAIALGALWYIAMIIGVSFAVPGDMIAGSDIPLADAASHAFGSRFAGYILIVAGIGGILTSWNAMFVGATRIIFAMARARMLPAVFARTHPKYGTPTAAIFLVGGIGIGAAFLGKNALGWFVDASSLGTVVAYLCVCISFILLRKKEPELERPFKIKRWKPIAFLATVACIFFISLYLPLGASALTLHEWAMVVLWIALGIILVFLNRKNQNSITEEQREKQIMGNYGGKGI